MTELSRRIKRPSRIARTAGLALAAGAACGMWGCEVDSFIDPSTVGRWEHTPTIMPILDRLASIEDESGTIVETSRITSDDLVPEAEQYRFGPGDAMEVRVRDFFTLGVEENFEIIVDPRGYIDIPKLDSVRAQGLTTPELKTAIEDAIRTARLNDRPVVSINVKAQRKQTFSVMGSIQTPGTYFIPAPDYRLLEGLTAAGSFSETIPVIYVIRQVPLSERTTGETPPSGVPERQKPTPPKQGEKPNGDKLIDLIEELSQPKKDEKPSPAMFGPTIDRGEGTSSPSLRPAERIQPPIELPEPTPRPKNGADEQPESPNAAAPKSDWVYVNGQWVRRANSVATQPAAIPGVEVALVTQRVIEVPTAQLLAGVADVNIVLRPGDVVRVPPPKSGLVYITGSINRPGPYNLPFEGRLTIQRAIVSAGGLSGIAIPERVDVTRMVGPDKQATIMLNLRAIEEQTQPDIYIKPDDIINIGTNFWAYPLAVVRSGLRASYGYGFILDRNFADSVYGPLQSASGN